MRCSLLSGVSQGDSPRLKPSRAQGEHLGTSKAIIADSKAENKARLNACQERMSGMKQKSPDIQIRLTVTSIASF